MPVTFEWLALSLAMQKPRPLDRHCALRCRRPWKWLPTLGRCRRPLNTAGQWDAAEPGQPPTLEMAADPGEMPPTLKHRGALGCRRAGTTTDPGNGRRPWGAGFFKHQREHNRKPKRNQAGTQIQAKTIDQAMKPCQNQRQNNDKTKPIS